MYMAFVPTIGLEIHAELKTRTKMFCSSPNDPDEMHPNTNVCPVCMGHPGTLPVVNREAVHQVLRMGAAVDGVLADFTEFDRKNYFYPDLPKGYQISQYQYPLVTKGSMNGVSITRIHLEEDTARSQHEGSDTSVVDFNRAGVPLMELVTEPCIHDASTASAFAQELQLLLRYLGAGEANMEKGQMRVEANISVSDTEVLGTKVEVKNLNSFKSVGKAIAFEVARQEKLIRDGGKVIQETRGWDEVKMETYPQRIKESSNDYRYFPDPDIPKLRLSRIDEFSRESVSKSLPELPWARRARYLSLGITVMDAETLVRNTEFSDFYDSEVYARLSGVNDRRLGINYLLSDVRGHDIKELVNLSNGVYAEIISMLSAGTIASRGAKMLIGDILNAPSDPKERAKELGVLQQKDPVAITRIAAVVIEKNPDVVRDFQSGKEEAMKYLLGQGMKESKGSIQPSELEKVIRSSLK
jgi:aspartyl-tRNA(Asn)/glutamyl-tRNA(Gln) amidotransferase subunit B